MTKSSQPVRITTNTTTVIVATTCLLAQLVIAVNGAGTTWKLRVQDGASPAHTIVPSADVIVPTDGKPIIINFDLPVTMTDGIKVVTPSGTPGEVTVWAHYFQ